MYSRCLAEAFGVRSGFSRSDRFIRHATCPAHSSGKLTRIYQRVSGLVWQELFPAVALAYRGGYVACSGVQPCLVRP